MLNLTHAPGAFFLRHRGEAYCGAFPDQRSRAWDPTHTQVGEVTEDQNSGEVGGHVPEWVGVLPYEAMRSLERRGGVRFDQRAEPVWLSPEWMRYPAVAQLIGDGVRIFADSESAAEELEALLFHRTPAVAVPVSLDWAAPPEPAHVHRRRIEMALEAIARGELYQVNLARRFDFHVTGSPFALLESLEKNGPAPFGAVIDLGGRSAVSLSPELFLDASRDGHVVTRPIKGTRPRLDGSRDEQLEMELERSEKERAELTMIIDLERNDLGRLAMPGSVRLVEGPRVVPYPTVLHREAEIEGQLYPGCSYRSLLETMCPSGSVTGAPKVAAMDWIAALEAERRGLYTGALGFFTRGSALQLSMAIRTLTLQAGYAQYYSGGGIVADSDPEQEIQETLWKAEQMSHLVQLGRALS